MPAKRCPACGTAKVRLAPRRTLLDQVLGTFTVYPLRCQLCTYRFRSFIGRPSTNPRRSYERVAVRYPVWFQSRFTRPAEGLGYPGTITNLSIRGCRIWSATPIPKGQACGSSSSRRPMTCRSPSTARSFARRRETPLDSAL